MTEYLQVAGWLGVGFVGVTALGWVSSLFEEPKTGNHDGSGHTSSSSSPYHHHQSFSAEDSNLLTEQLMVYLNKAKNDIDQGKFNEAELQSRRIIEALEKSGYLIEIYYQFIALLGRLYSKLEQFEKAEATLEKGVNGMQRNPSQYMSKRFLILLDQLLDVKIKLKKYDQAEQLCQTFTHLPGIMNGNLDLYHRSLIHLGRIYLLQGKIKQSRELYDSLVDNLDAARLDGMSDSFGFQTQQPKLAEILTQLGDVNYEAGWLEQAEHWLTTLRDRFPLSINKMNLLAHNQLANLYWQKQNDEAAETIYSRIIATPSISQVIDQLTTKNFLRTKSRYFQTQDAGLLWNLEKNMASFFIKLSIRDLDHRQQLLADPTFKPLAPGFLLHVYFQNPSIDREEKKEEEEEAEAEEEEEAEEEAEAEDEKKKKNQEESNYLITHVLSAEQFKKREIFIQSSSFSGLRKKPYHVRILVYAPNNNNNNNDQAEPERVSSHHDLIVSKLNTTSLTTADLRQLFENV